MWSAELSAECRSALKPYFLNPCIQESFLYGIDVYKSLADFVDACDKDLMEIYLKRMCGNQYGFGDNPESANHIKKNLSSDLLDNSDIITTKPIGNFFGNVDQELKG